jgi:hypothetical protein
VQKLNKRQEYEWPDPTRRNLQKCGPDPQVDPTRVQPWVVSRDRIYTITTRLMAAFQRRQIVAALYAQACMIST